MDPFTHLNYRYPGTSNAARVHVSQQPQGSPQHGIQNCQSIQDRTYPGDGYMCSDSSRKGTPIGPHIYHRMDESVTLSDQYIPSSSDKITCTDHRPLDEIFGNTRPSSGWPQAKSGSVYLSHNETSHGHPQRAPVLTYPLPTRPQVDGVLQIPLLVVDNQMMGTGLVVDFRCSDWGIGVQVEGIPMSDLLHGNVSGLEDPYQRVLDGLGLTDLRFNILWPHYPPFAKVISAFGTDGKPITRAGLGYEAALAFGEFFYQITSQSILPAQPGPYTVSASPGSSPSGIKFDQLHLITVRNTSRGEWIAEIRAVSMS